MNFRGIRAMVLLQSFVIMSGGRLPETENKRMCQISGPKRSRSRLRNLLSGRLREVVAMRELSDCIPKSKGPSQ